jgi:hypothetical protein
MLGFIPTPEALAKILTEVCATVGITPFIEADENLTVIERAGKFDALMAIEREYKDAKLKVPYDCTDLLDGKTYRKGETVFVERYGVKLLKKV